MPTLTDKTIEDLRGKFKEWGVTLPPEVWLEQESTANYLELMANGKLPSKAYLNSLWTGAGKTTLMTCFVKVLLESEEHRDVGVIICLPFLRQIRTLAAELDPSQFHVYVGKTQTYVDEESGEKRYYNDLSPTPHNDAQVLFTTQNMVESRLADGSNFGDLQYFHYKGKPRIVKIWDEALIPWEDLVLTVPQIGGSAVMLSSYMAEIPNRIIKIAAELNELKDGSTYRFPDFEEEYGAAWDDIREDISVKRESLAQWERRVAHTLWKLSNKTAQVTKDISGRTIIDWRQSLPDDFYPVVAFDASGRIRTMYEFYAYSTGKLHYTNERYTQRDWSHLTFHHINLAAGKNAWKKNSGRLVKAIKAALDQEPDRKTLVITHKPDRQKKIPDIEKLLAKDHSNAKVLTWGSHKQTNEFREYDKLILAGLLYLPKSAIRVTTYGSLQAPVSQKLDDAERCFDAIERGEIRSDLLQAVGRINRNSSNPADIYIIASDQQIGSIQELISETFEGAQYRLVKLPKEGKEAGVTHAELLSHILREHVLKYPGTNLTFKATKGQYFKGMSKQDWATLRAHRLVQSTLTELGYEEARYPGRTYYSHWAPTSQSSALSLAA